jgi:hypothetical protein
MYFAGLDAHLEYVTIAVLDRMGQVALETTVSTKAVAFRCGRKLVFRPCPTGPVIGHRPS